MLNKVLVPTDGSESSLKAVHYAQEMLKKGIASKVILLHVGPAIGEHWGFYGLANADLELKYQCLLDDEGQRVLRLVEKSFKDANLPVETVFQCGDSAETIVNYAEENEFDLIIIGNKGLGKLAQLLLGSVCERVIRLASVPVMVIK
jgi:nucleotide-binding universal stress UspA family protein